LCSILFLTTIILRDKHDAMTWEFSIIDHNQPPTSFIRNMIHKWTSIFFFFFFFVFPSHPKKPFSCIQFQCRNNYKIFTNKNKRKKTNRREVLLYYLVVYCYYDRFQLFWRRITKLIFCNRLPVKWLLEIERGHQDQ
jgi:hypothetical protein